MFYLYRVYIDKVNYSTQLFYFNNKNGNSLFWVLRKVGDFTTLGLVRLPLGALLFKSGFKTHNKGDSSSCYIFFYIREL